MILNNNKTEQPIAIKIAEIYDEAENIKTFKFNEKIQVKPGQFVLLWIPRVDLKPFGISYWNEDSFGITVSKVGRFTEELFNKQVGDMVGIQGPYGNGFSMDKKNVVLAAGGYGAAPLAFLAQELEKKGTKVTFIIGAKTKNCLVYESRFKNSKINLICVTDDGSFGIKGFSTDALKQVLEKDKNIDMVYTVGPEIMMKKVIGITDEYNIECEASLERYIKCGFGVCGQCCVDGSGVRICQEGPVFNKEFIKNNISEFGEYKRDKISKKHKE